MEYVLVGSIILFNPEPVKLLNHSEYWLYIVLKVSNEYLFTRDKMMYADLFGIMLKGDINGVANGI